MGSAVSIRLTKLHLSASGYFFLLNGRLARAAGEMGSSVAARRH